MRISFRQGLVRVPANFLVIAAGKVSLVLPPAETVVATLADGTNDYLITERLSITDAWTGPFVAGTDYWLYIDINTTTGARTFGHTIYEPVETATAPTVHPVGQCWFDTVNNTFKVWTGSSWVRKVRVFAAKLQGGTTFLSMSIISPIFTGTQVGELASQPINAGALVFDSVSGSPLKRGDGTFFTTENLALTGVVSSSQVKVGSIIVEAEALSPIPAYSIVRFADFNKVEVATNSMIEYGTYGIVEYDAATGAIASVVLEGLVQNLNWDWTAAGVNAAVYVDATGTLTTGVVPNPIPVAAVVDAHTILLRPSSLFLSTITAPMSTTHQGIAKLSVVAANPNDPIVVGTNDTRITAVVPHIADATVHLTTNENTFLDSLVATAGGITVMTGAYAGATRTLQAPATGLTIANPAGLAGDPTFAFANDLAALEALNTTGFAVRTDIDTWTQRQIAGTLNRLSVTNGDGVLGNPTLDIDALYAGQATIATVGTITAGTWNGTSIAPLHGGTGFTTNGTVNQLIAVSSTDAAVWEYKTVSGTTNQVTVTPGAGTLVLSLPQSINTTADVAFNSVNAPIVKSAILTLTDAASIAWDMSLGIHATVTLTTAVGATRVLANPTVLQAGAIVVLKVVQDATGGWALTYDTAYKWAGGAAPTVAAGANAVSVLTFFCDGTNLLEISRSLAVA